MIIPLSYLLVFVDLCQVLATCNESAQIVHSDFGSQDCTSTLNGLLQICVGNNHVLVQYLLLSQVYSFSTVVCCELVYMCVYNMLNVLVRDKFVCLYLIVILHCLLSSHSS